uniref:Uncharacterized protein n=1 Tax=Glossina austeni TaxID=7395 RepID=A0A1A9VPH4_GLOAU
MDENKRCFEYYHKTKLPPPEKKEDIPLSCNTNKHVLEMLTYLHIFDQHKKRSIPAVYTIAAKFLLFAYGIRKLKKVRKLIRFAGNSSELRGFLMVVPVVVVLVVVLVVDVLVVVVVVVLVDIELLLVPLLAIPKFPLALVVAVAFNPTLCCCC